jgi:hypothetical protein
LSQTRCSKGGTFGEAGRIVRMATTEAEYLAFWDELRRTGERWPPLNTLRP